MWHVTIEEDLTCIECWHNIPAGSNCLSQMPVNMPDRIHRRGYENFCIKCAECERKEKKPCYVRRLDHWYTHTAETKEAVSCGYCGELITKGTWTVAQKLYAWPDPGWESKSTQLDAGGADTVARAAGAASAGAAMRTHGGTWHNLSPTTQRLFQTGGLGRGLSSRSLPEAQQLYESSIPQTIRHQGESAVLHFKTGRQFSHRFSVFNRPDLAKSPINVFLEDAKKNLTRGSRNMTTSEISEVRSVYRRSAVSATAKNAAKGGLVAAAIEAPVAGMENFFHWKHGRKSGRTAAMDTAKSTAGAGAVGVGVTVGAVGVAKGAALVGISPTLGPAGIPLAVAGGVLIAGSTVYRVIKAVKQDIPLDEYHLFFCKDADCKTKFAQEVTNTALGRD